MVPILAEEGKGTLVNACCFSASGKLFAAVFDSKAAIVTRVPPLAEGLTSAPWEVVATLYVPWHVSSLLTVSCSLLP